MHSQCSTDHGGHTLFPTEVGSASELWHCVQDWKKETDHVAAIYALGAKSELTHRARAHVVHQAIAAIDAGGTIDSSAKVRFSRIL